jgi:hypothetical protein
MLLNASRVDSPTLGFIMDMLLPMDNPPLTSPESIYNNKNGDNTIEEHYFYAPND